ncbi:MAG: ISNCY family transposase [Planctomycetota bacterium]|jgi:IS5 family transposase
MRRKRDTQGWLEFQASNLELTNRYFAKYEAISQELDEAPKLLELLHRDLGKALKAANRGRRKKQARRFRFTTDNVLRLMICQILEGESLRGIVIRVDDSSYLRRFTRLFDGPMMDFTTLCRLRNAIRPETWKRINAALARAAVERGAIDGEELRLDTTAVETNIHWPTDSSLLWDGYRTLASRIESARKMDSGAVGDRRIHLRRAKKIAHRISRKSRPRGRKAVDLKPLYKRLIGQVESICEWSTSLQERLEAGLREGRYDVVDHLRVEAIVADLAHFLPLVRRVIWQSGERVLRGRVVPNGEKLFSIFEPHTELLKRGKVQKDIEFGHMIQIQQVAEKFITDYEVFHERPQEPSLLRPALKSHERLFGKLPGSLAADRGYWEAEEMERLRQEVELVSIPRKGGGSKADRERERDPVFRHAQAFRAGVEGTISFLKRVLRLTRCFCKGWEHYESTVGATVFAHNLLVLARC